MLPRILPSLAIFLFLVIALVAVYWSGLHGSFFFDDVPNIVLAERLQNAQGWDGIVAALGDGASSPLGRPLAQLSFALNIAAGGLAPFPFKVVNLAIHGVCGVLVFFVAGRVFATCRSGGSMVSPALATALWLLHPVQLLAVLHVVQRMTSLSALFLLAALLCHMRGRERTGPVAIGFLLAGWFLFWPLSVLSKETGLLFPLYALVWELMVRPLAAGHLDRFARILSGFVAGAGVLILVYLSSPWSGWLWAGYDMRGFSAGERLLTEARVVWFYLGLVVFPQLEAFALFHDDIPVSKGLLDPWTTLPALLGLAGLAWVVWYFRKRVPMLSFGVAWFLVGHLLESTFLPLEIAHEHRNYLPSVGILLALVSLVTPAFQNRGVLKTLAVSVSVAFLLHVTGVTAIRSHIYGDEFRRAQIEAQHHRDSARSQHDAGRVMLEAAGDGAADSPLLTLAGRHFEIAADLDHDAKMPLLGLMELQCQMAGTVDRDLVAKLAARLRETPFAPGDRNVLYSLKEGATGSMPCLTRAVVVPLFEAALGNPGLQPAVRAVILSWFADYLWLREQDLEAARTALAESLRLVPGSPSNQLKWAQLLFLSGERAEARQVLERIEKGRLAPSERQTLEELLQNV